MSKLVTHKRAALISSLMSVLLAFGATFSMTPAAYARPVQPHFNHFLSTHGEDEELYDDNQPDDAAAAEAYDNRAYPQSYINYDRVVGTYNAFQATLAKNKVGKTAQWQQVGPANNYVPGPVTYTGRESNVSGRTTALLVSNKCYPQDCRTWVGTAGGGVWLTYDGLAKTPEWHSSSNGLASNAIGSITQDPNDATGATLYVGTGEPNGSSDSEAGVGLYRSTDGGNYWQLVKGSVPVSKDRSIGAVAVDPVNAKHIYIGTAVARHGSSSVNGGRFTPPGAPKIGLYESTDGGATFKLVFSQATDTVNPGSPNGNDFFRGGISKIQFDRTGLATGQASRVYFSVFDYGLYRGNGQGTYEQVFASAGGGTVANSTTSRTEFALAPMGSKLRIYLGDTGSGPADLYRVDDANIAATALTNGTANPGWIKLSNPKKGTPGYSSYNYCGGQCSYDMPVASPPGKPDIVWIGGQMQYDEIFTPNPPSNGRAVQRSSDAGVSFTDMTNDTLDPPTGMHPDQHAIAFNPKNPEIAFLGSDGGIVRTSGAYADDSADCDSRGLKGDDLVDCKQWLKLIPTQLFPINKGLATLQFQSLSVNPQNPKGDIMGGTQDNGTWSYNQGTNAWFESVGGDGGQSGIDSGNPNIRFHTYYGPQVDVNFNATDPLGWDWISDPLVNSKEAASFYIPIITDPKVSQTFFAGLEHVWRTQDSGGNPAYLQKHCNENFGDFAVNCGDWVPLGGPTLVGTSYGTDKGGSYVVALKRAPGDTNTLWAATRRGRLFVSENANAADPASVTFNRIDTAAQPTRFISGISVDPKNPYHAFVSYSGYNAYTPTTPGHVFEVTYNPATKSATWKDVSYDLGDAPITDIAYDSVTGDLYAATDFGVLLLKPGTKDWDPAAAGLPPVAVYGLTIVPSARILYAATHGRSAWKLDLG